MRSRQRERLVQALDLRGVVVTGDAGPARGVGQIVEAQGDYLWTVKDNQPELYNAIAVLFQPHVSRPEWSAPPMDFRAATTVEKGHGRLEKRTITGSLLLAGSSDFPFLAQVFRLESWACLPAGRSRHEIRYGLTSLPAQSASPAQLLTLSREHLGIENGLHYRRDATMREDHSQLRMGYAPHLQAILNTIVIGPLVGRCRTNLAEGRREFAYQFDRSLAALAA